MILHKLEPGQAVQFHKHFKDNLDLWYQLRTEKGWERFERQTWGSKITMLWFSCIEETKTAAVQKLLNFLDEEFKDCECFSYTGIAIESHVKTLPFLKAEHQASIMLVALKRFYNTDEQIVNEFI